MSELRIRRPEEGWLTLALVAFMVIVLAWVIDDPGWVNGKEALTDGLPLFAVLGFAVGFLGPKLGWGRWTTHLVGAAFAGLLIPVFAGWALYPGLPIAEAFDATARGSVQAYLDIAWLGHEFTSQEIHYVLVLGILIWGTAQFAAYAVFGHRHPLNAIIVTGLVLLANMALTSRDQAEMPYLIAFTAASLFLLIRMHAFDEQTTWVRRRIGDPATISALYLRGGTVFIVVALVGSLFLTQRAASSPLAGAWDGVSDQLIAVGDTVSGWFPVGGDFRGVGGVTFGDSARISPQWISDRSVAFTATVPAAAQGEKWRAAAYDTFTLTAWEATDTRSVATAGGSPLLVGTPEDPSPDLTEQVTVDVRPADRKDATLLSPGTPATVSHDASVVLGGASNWFARVDLGDRRAAYTVSAAILQLDDDTKISGNRLRQASEDYPADIAAHFTDVPPGAMGPDAQELLATVKARAKSSDPYDLAVAMEAYLRDDTVFHYNRDLRNVPCSDVSAVECFARTHQGYCLHYASTMAILLRAANPANPIPTRLVQGFLPGDLNGTTETVTNDKAHAWVEVYFPGYGWIPFDPTGGGVGQKDVIQEGPQLPSLSPTPRASGDSEGPDPTRRIQGNTGDVGPQGPSNINRPDDRGLLIVVTLVLALLVGGVAFAAWLRGPRGELSPERAWSTMARAASRFGFAPRPTQTVYEYAATLGELVPIAKADLHTVAEAKVESSYARVRLGGDRLMAVQEATRRLRVSLLRLVLRRGARRKPR